MSLVSLTDNTLHESKSEIIVHWTILAACMNDVLMSADVNMHARSFADSKVFSMNSLSTLIIQFFFFFFFRCHERIPNGSTRFNGVMLNYHAVGTGGSDRRVFGITLSVCPLASPGYDFT